MLSICAGGSIYEQECIPVECVLTAAVAATRCQYQGGFCPEGIFLHPPPPVDRQKLLKHYFSLWSLIITKNLHCVGKYFVWYIKGYNVGYVAFSCKVQAKYAHLPKMNTVKQSFICQFLIRQFIIILLLNKLLFINSSWLVVFLTVKAARWFGKELTWRQVKHYSFSLA